MRAIILLLASSAAYAGPGEISRPIPGIEVPYTMPPPTCAARGKRVKRCYFRDGTEVVCVRSAGSKVCFIVDAREV